MAVTFNSSRALFDSATSVNSTNVSGFNVTGSANALTAVVNFGQSVSNIQAHWDNTGTNQSMSLTAQKVNTGAVTSVQIFTLLNPTTGTGKQLGITWTGAAQCDVGLASWNGVGSFINVTNTVVTSNTASVLVPTQTGDIVLYTAVSPSANYTSGTGNSLFNDNAAANFTAFSGYRLGSGTNTLASAWGGSSTNQVMTALDITATIASNIRPPTSQQQERLASELYFPPMDFILLGPEPHQAPPVSLWHPSPTSSDPNVVDAIQTAWLPPEQQTPFQTLQSYYGSGPQYVQLAPSWIPSPPYADPNIIDAIQTAWIPPDPQPILPPLDAAITPKVVVAAQQLHTINPNILATIETWWVFESGDFELIETPSSIPTAPAWQPFPPNQQQERMASEFYFPPMDFIALGPEPHAPPSAPFKLPTSLDPNIIATIETWWIDPDQRPEPLQSPNYIPQSPPAQPPYSANQQQERFASELYFPPQEFIGLGPEPHAQPSFVPSVIVTNVDPDVIASVINWWNPPVQFLFAPEPKSEITQALGNPFDVNIVATIQTWWIPPDPQPQVSPKYIPLAPAWQPYVTHQQEIVDLVWNIPPDPAPQVSPKYIPLAPAWQSYVTHQQEIVDLVWNVTPDPLPELPPKYIPAVTGVPFVRLPNAILDSWAIPDQRPEPLQSPNYIPLAPAWQPYVTHQQEIVDLVWNIPPDPAPQVSPKYIPLAPAWQPYVTHQQEVVDLVWNIAPDPQPQVAARYPQPFVSTFNPFLRPDAVLDVWNVAPDPAPQLPVKYIPLAPAWQPYVTRQQDIVNEIWNIPPDPLPTLKPFYPQQFIATVPVAAQQQNIVASIWNIPPDPAPILGQKYIPLAPAWQSYVTHQQEIVDLVWNIPPDPLPTLKPFYPQPVIYQTAYLPEQQNVVVEIWNIPPDPLPTLGTKYIPLAPAWQPYVTRQQDIANEVWNLPPDPPPQVPPKLLQAFVATVPFARIYPGILDTWNIPPDPLPTLLVKSFQQAPSWQPYVTYQQQIVDLVWNIPPDPQPILPPPYPAVPPVVNNPPFGIPDLATLETILQWWEPPPPQPTLNILQTPPTGPTPPPVIVPSGIDPDAVPPYREPLTPELIRMLKKLLARRKYANLEEKTGVREALLDAIAKHSWVGEEEGPTPTPEGIRHDQETQLYKVNEVKRAVEQAGGKGVYDFRPVQRTAVRIDAFYQKNPQAIQAEYEAEQARIAQDFEEEELAIEKVIERRLFARRLMAEDLLED